MRAATGSEEERHLPRPIPASGGRGLRLEEATSQEANGSPSVPFSLPVPVLRLAVRGALTGHRGFPRPVGRPKAIPPTPGRRVDVCAATGSEEERHLPRPLPAGGGAGLRLEEATSQEASGSSSAPFSLPLPVLRRAVRGTLTGHRGFRAREADLRSACQLARRTPKIRCRSPAVRMSRRARRAKSPLGANSITRRQRSTASR